MLCGVDLQLGKIIGRQSEGSLIRGFNNLVLTRTLTNSKHRPIYSTFMTVGLTDPRIIDTLPLVKHLVSSQRHDVVIMCVYQGTF